MSLRVRARAPMGPGRLDVEVVADPILGVYGPSGAGKSTLIAEIAGLGAGETRVQLAERDLAGPPHRRGLGVVFQEDRLFPHRTVAQNLAFGGAPDAALVDGLALRPLLTRRPAALSGGERRRVALGRALARAPRAILLDEPFSGLDPALRAAVIGLVVERRRALDVPLLCVSHDLAALVALGGPVVCLDKGRITQRGPPPDLLVAPAEVGSEVRVGGSVVVWPHPGWTGPARFIVPASALVFTLASAETSLGVFLEARAAADGVTLADGTIVPSHTPMWAGVGTALRCWFAPEAARLVRLR